MLSNKSELFVEISEEQQEVVAGGDIGFFNFNGALYDANGVINGSVVGAGAGGATAISGTTIMDITSIGVSLQGLEVT
jgi:hypothetical protein